MALLDRVQASAQALAARRATGAALGNWNEAESIIALAILVYADPARLGGSRVIADGTSSQHPAVVAAALAVGRTEDAVVMKVQNQRYVLTGGARGMPGGSKLDRWAVGTFAGHLDEMLACLFVVADVVPGAMDVYRLLCGPGIDVDELVGDDQPETGDRTTERSAEVVVRRGQGVFRGRVLANYNHGCAFCGLRSRHPDRNTYLLVASHILPWRDADDHQRLDPRNGFSLCATHDRAFEWGFVTVDDDLRVVVSAGTQEHYEPLARIKAEILDLHGREIDRAPRGFEAPGESYMKHHREVVFDKRFRAA